jgi:hypothetical protein
MVFSLRQHGTLLFIGVDFRPQTKIDTSKDGRYHSAEG